MQPDVLRELQVSELVVLEDSRRAFLESGAHEKIADRLIARSLDERGDQPRRSFGLERRSHAIEDGVVDAASQRTATHEQWV